MKKALLFPGLVLLLAACHRQPAFYLPQGTAPYQTRDLTAENLFTNNIEGPAFRHDTLFVVNYQHDGTIGMVFPGGRCELYLDLPKGSTANSIKFDLPGNMYLADFSGHNILKVDLARHVRVYCHEDRFNQPNDICRSRTGRIYASDPDWKDSTGRIWLIDTGGRARVLEDSMGTTNGITLSPDEKHLYVDESDQLRVWQYDVDSAGHLSKKRLFTTFRDYGLDGMHCDTAGNLYICRYGKGAIDVFSPQGKMLREISLKGKDCSNFVFGDPDGKTVFVTLQDRKCMEMFRVETPGATHERLPAKGS
jgi:sugar lactone lactonase YvrE